MIEAFIICDFDNETSMRYLEKSLESFSAVDDIIKITPIQCTTPSTLPIRYGEMQEPIPFYVDLETGDRLGARFFGGTFCDTPIYNCIMHSQWQLIGRIANGEPIAIMEHDAALINEDSFREMIDLFWGDVDVFMPGACMEFYGLSQRFARWMYDILDNFPYNEDQRYSGPFGVISNHEGLGCDIDYPHFLVPTKTNDDLDKIVFGRNIWSAQAGNGNQYEPACKQFYFRQTKNTNAMQYDYVLNGLTCPSTSVRPRDFIFLDE